MIAWADVANLDPSLSTTSGGTQTAILADVYRTLDAGRWGVKLDQGALYLAAHIGVLSKRSGNGRVQSERLGDAATSYAVPVAVGLYDLGETTWGQHYTLLIRSLGVFAVVT